MFKSKILLLFLSILQIPVYMQECTDDYRGWKDLGNGYVYDYSDPHIIDIVYTSKANYESAGIEVIPHKVEKVSFNKQYIIAKQKDTPHDSAIYYWIIDKHRTDSTVCKGQGNWDSCIKSIEESKTGPMDSLTFTNELRKRNIDLKFED
jgi:hypothetical protein